MGISDQTLEINFEPFFIQRRTVQHSIEKLKISSNRGQTQRTTFRFCRILELEKLFVSVTRLDGEGLGHSLVELGQVLVRSGRPAKICHLLLHDWRYVTYVWDTFKKSFQLVKK